MQQQKWLVAVLVGFMMCLLMMNNRTNVSAQEKTPPRVATENNNRFQLALGEKHCFVLDSKNGRVWQLSLIRGAVDTSRGFHDAKIKEETGGR